MTERTNTPRRVDAAVFTPSGGKAPSQPAVWVERSTFRKDSVSPDPATSRPRRLA